MKTTVDTMYEEATRALEGYLATGIAGLFHKAVDRLSVVGVAVRQFEATRENAELLLNHIQGERQ